MATPLSFQSPLASTFLDTVKTVGLTNPYGLAAVFSTGKHESGWAPKNVWGEWADPSESGKPGRAGGSLSWRAERLDNLRSFAKSRGDDPRRPSVETQAEFFLSEDPSLIEALQGSKSDVEAQRIMDNAWRFAGYDRPGGEAARRLRTTQETLGEILGGEAVVTPTGSAGNDTLEDDMAIGGEQSGGAGGGGFFFPPVKQPENRSQMLAMVLKNMQDDAKRPNPQSWLETGARALTQGIQGYMAGKTMSQNEADEDRQREVLAGILEGINPQAAAAARAGIGDNEAWQSAMVKQMFAEPDRTNLPSSVREFEYAQENPEFLEYKRGADKPSDREQRVQMMVDNGTPPEIATGIATGQFVVRTNPYSQQPEVVNLADGKVVFDGNTQAGAPAASQGDPGAPVPDSAAPAAEQGRPSYIPDGVDPTDATGASGFVGGLVNQVSDLFGQGVPFPEIEEAAEALNTTQILTMSLLQAEIPGRPSQFLLQKLEKLTVDAKSLARADERSVTRLKQTRDLIKHEVDRVERDILARPQDFKPADMTKARLNSSQLKGLLKAYDAMLGTVATRRGESKPGLEQFDRRGR